MDEDALRRDAALPGVGEAGDPDLRAAAFQSLSASMITGALLPSSRPTFLRGARARIAPADLGRAGERDHGDVVVVDDGVADRAAAAGDDVQLLGGQPALVDQQLGERDGAERRLARRLEHDRAAGGDRRGELVGDEVEREVERG